VKERLTGAIILVALIVLLVPELLSGPKPGRAPGAATGSSEEPPLRSYTINLAEDARQRTGSTTSGPAMPQPGGAEQGTQSAPTAASAEQSEPAAGAANPNELAGSRPAPVEPTPTTPPPLPKAAAQNPASRSSGTKATTSTAKPMPVAKTATAAKGSASTAPGWMVQLGVFASRDNAERLALDVRVKGLRASVSEVTTSGRKLYRVRVGPAADRAGAQELQARLRAVGRPSGTIVPSS
jgi:DedD protein